MSVERIRAELAAAIEDLPDALIICIPRSQLAALLDVAEALKSIADRHPDALPGEHPAVDIARTALAALESTPSVS